jgi:hypothetical protein
MRKQISKNIRGGRKGVYDLSERDYKRGEVVIGIPTKNSKEKA